jgi:hypothetical protein
MRCRGPAENRRSGQHELLSGHGPRLLPGLAGRPNPKHYDPACAQAGAGLLPMHHKIGAQKKGKRAYTPATTGTMGKAPGAHHFTWPFRMPGTHKAVHTITAALPPNSNSSCAGQARECLACWCLQQWQQRQRQQESTLACAALHTLSLSPCRGGLHAQEAWSKAAAHGVEKGSLLRTLPGSQSTARSPVLL